MQFSKLVNVEANKFLKISPKEEKTDEDTCRKNKVKC